MLTNAISTAPLLQQPCRPLDQNLIKCTLYHGWQRPISSPLMLFVCSRNTWMLPWYFYTLYTSFRELYFTDRPLLPPKKFFGCAEPLFSKFSDIWGRKVILLTGTGIFLFGSALSGAAKVSQLWYTTVVLLYES